MLQYVLNYTLYCLLLPLWFAAVTDCIRERGIGLYFPAAIGHFGVLIFKAFEALSGEYRTYFSLVTAGYCGPGSVIGTATSYGLDGPGIESRWGARFSAPVHTGPGAHPASCTMSTGSFPGVNSNQGVTPWS